MLCLVSLSPSGIIPDDINNKILLILAVTSLFIIIGILFRIYDKVIANKGYLKSIRPNDLYDEILKLTKPSKNVKIQCIGVAGRFGWYSVLSRLLDQGNYDSLHEANKFIVEIGLISPKFYSDNKDILERFDELFPVIEDIQRTKQQLDNLYSKEDHKKVNLYQYDYLPNFIGFLVNDNYLFLNICHWDELDNSELIFRGGGTEYLSYHKNDEFGGSIYIELFTGWFNFIKKIMVIKHSYRIY